MNKQLSFSKTMQWLARFFELQLFLSLISLPFLIAWGLPLSLVSPVANLLFSPILTAFLFISSLLFFTELLCIPNSALAWCLKKLTAGWLWALSWSHHSWLIGFPKPPTWFLYCIPIATITIISWRKKNNSLHTIAALSMLLAAIFTGLHLSNAHTSAVVEIPCHDEQVTLICHNNQTVLIDTGVIGKRTSACSWATYKLTSQLIYITGHLGIDHLILLQPGARVFEAVATLCTKIPIGNVYMPFWDGTLPRGAWRHFFTLRDTLRKKNGNLIRTGNYKRTIALSRNAYIQIEPLETQLKYHTATFNAQCVHGQIDKKPFAFYASKHKRKSSFNEGESHVNKESTIRCSL